MVDFRDVLTVQKVIVAEPSRIFQLLATPSRHHEFDGSGTVNAVRGQSGMVKLGDSFAMDMKMGFRYHMVNHVVEFEQDRLIAWATRPPTPADAILGGRVWRYQLHPVENGTHVAHTWDLRTEKPLTKIAVKRMREMTRKNMTRTLDRIAQVVQT